MKANEVLQERTNVLLTEKYGKLEKELSEKSPDDRRKRVQLDDEIEEAFNNAKKRRLVFVCEDPATLEKIGSSSLEDEIYNSCQYNLDDQLKPEKGPGSALAQYLVDDSLVGIDQRRKCQLALHEKLKIERSFLLKLKDEKGVCFRIVQVTNEMYQECGL